MNEQLESEMLVVNNIVLFVLPFIIMVTFLQVTADVHHAGDGQNHSSVYNYGAISQTSERAQESLQFAVEDHYETRVSPRESCGR